MFIVERLVIGSGKLGFVLRRNDVCHNIVENRAWLVKTVLDTWPAPDV